MKHYTQLTREERYQIYALKAAGHNQADIAKVIGRHKSTVSRELIRNRGLKGYRPKQAHSSRKELFERFFFLSPFISCRNKDPIVSTNL